MKIKPKTNKQTKQTSKQFVRRRELLEMKSFVLEIKKKIKGQLEHRLDSQNKERELHRLNIPGIRQRVIRTWYRQGRREREGPVCTRYERVTGRIAKRQREKRWWPRILLE